MFSHEASIIATKERTEMKMIEFFIPRKLSLTLGIQSQSAVNRKAPVPRRQLIPVSGSPNGSESRSKLFHNNFLLRIDS
jgi:hypothetical protein